MRMRQSNCCAIRERASCASAISRQAEERPRCGSICRPVGLGETDIRDAPALALKRRVGVLISGRGTNMAALVEAAREPGFPAEIALVVSNRPDAAGLLLARHAGVAVVCV